MPDRSVIVVPRDRFSTTLDCLETLVKNTPEPHELIIVMGGAPPKLEEALTGRYGSRAKLIFEKRFLNPAQSRNLGLRAASEPLAALVDNDVYVRPGWLSALLKCQAETGAAMVVPLVLESPTEIHTAGNDLYINVKNGERHIHKVLRHMKKPYHDNSNLKRVPTDYGELHCQLVDVKVALDLAVFDEKIREVGELDCGLAWAKAGQSMWFEPASVVFYAKPLRITDPVDIRFFTWRWDMRGILEGYRHFKQKWGMDAEGQGSFKGFLADFNNMVGLLPRLWPSRVTLFIDHRLVDLRRFLENTLKIWRRFKAVLMGYTEWQ